MQQYECFLHLYQPSVSHFFLDQKLPITSEVVRLWFTYLVDVYTFGESPNSVVVCSRHVFISDFILFSYYITKTQLGLFLTIFSICLVMWFSVTVNKKLRMRY